MRDALYEESVQSVKADREVKMYTVFHVFSIICLIVALIIALFFFSVQFPALIYDKEATTVQKIVGCVVWLLFVAVFVLMWFLFTKIKRRFNLCYDYLFVEDELRITRVFNGKKRKFLCKLEADHILKIGYCEKDSFERTVSGLNGKKPKILTPNLEPAEGKMFIYVLYSTTTEKNVYVIECRQMMLEYLVRAAGRNKFERE